MTSRVAPILPSPTFRLGRLVSLRLNMGVITLVTLRALTLKPGLARGLVNARASSAGALARAGEVTTTNDVASVLPADALSTLRVVDVGILAGVPGTFPSFPV